MTMQGANPEELDALAGRMGQSADLLNTTRSEISSLLGATSWVGPDAESFLGAWHSQLNSILANVSEVIHGVDQQLRFEAEQQRNASAAGGSGAGSADRGTSWVRAAETGILGIAGQKGVASAAGIFGFVFKGVKQADSIAADVFKGARFLDPFGEAKDLAKTVGIINSIDKLPGILSGPAHWALGNLSRIPGVGTVADWARGPAGDIIDKAGKFLGPAGIAVSVATTGYSVYQFARDPNYQNAEGVLNQVKGDELYLGPPGWVAAGGIQLGEWGSDALWSHFPTQMEGLHNDFWNGVNVVSGTVSQGYTSAVRGADVIWHDTTGVAGTVSSAAGDAWNGITHIHVTLPPW